MCGDRPREREITPTEGKTRVQTSDAESHDPDHADLENAGRGHPADRTHIDPFRIHHLGVEVEAGENAFASAVEVGVL
eukprot:m.324693 g.324693  ORF g.324693 m.324693 type:complete len:78 (+) comp20374_c0_seq4:1058-1291(+)